MKQLKLLKKEYNIAIERYKNMTEWCKTATLKEQEKNYAHIVEVINDCSSLLNEIKAYMLVTPGEILNGFKRS